MTINKTSHLASKKRKKGFTLTEIAIVLGIIGLILGAIWTAASSVYTNQRTSHAQTAILAITQGVRSMYASQSQMNPNGTAITDITYALLNAGVIPSDMPDNNAANPAAAGDQALGPFPNTNGIVSQTAVMTNTDENGFVVVMNGVPSKNCVPLIMAISGSNRDPGLFTATAVANALPTTGADGLAVTGTPLTNPITVAQASTVAPAAVAPTALNLAGGCTLAATTAFKVKFGFSLK